VILKHLWWSNKDFQFLNILMNKILLKSIKIARYLKQDNF